MTGTYEMVRALPAKGFDWNGFCSVMTAKAVAVGAANERTVAEWAAAKGMRQVRVAAMEMANFYVSQVARRSFRSAPTDESRMWDSFEGGHHEVWTDADALEAATKEVAALIDTFR